jgi:phosphoglucosamine mutase
VGGNVIRAGVVPTPAIAHLVQQMKADCGVVISASHNPYEYNGIKFFNRDGFKLDDAIEDEIEALIRGSFGAQARKGREIGRTLERAEDALHSYVDYLTQSVEERFGGLKIVIDCANGAASRAAPLVFEKLGAEAIFIGNTPDGMNINDKVGSTYPETLQKVVLREKADLGLAFDGDADRLIAVDEKGNIIDGDMLMYVCAKDMKDQGCLSGNLLTATVMSNIGLKVALEEAGIDLQLADVGDRYVLEMMRRTGSVLGGEQSGHIIFLDKNTTGDGLYAALRFTGALLREGVKASEAVRGIHIFPQVLVNARVRNENKNRYAEDEEIHATIDKIESQFAGEGRVLIRPSGTEPLVRVMIEGADQQQLNEAAQSLSALIEKKLG